MLRVHVPQRHRLQPRVAEPHEVRGCGRRVRRRELSIRGQADPHRPGDPGRQRLLPHAADRGEQPQVPPARTRLRQPRRAADEPRPGLRQRRGSQLRGRPHRDHARRGVQAVVHHRPRSRRSVLGLPGEPRAVPPRHQQAPRRGLRDHPEGCPAGPARSRQGRLRRGPGARHGPRLSQRPGHRARAHRHDRLHDGLRYDRHRARHRAHQVQEARRRGLHQDRQPDRPGGPAQARLRRGAGRRDPRLRQRARDHRGCAAPQATAPAGLRLRVQAGQRRAVHPLHGPRPDDGCRPAVPVAARSARP